jgi:hypothetical protein
MRSLLLSPVLILLAIPSLSMALPNLPVPLQLPPGGFETLKVSKAASYYGDAIRIVDCPSDKDQPFGSCGNEVMGGDAIYDSHLSGYLEIKFYTPIHSIVHFEITTPSNLTGDPTVIRAPQLYQFPITQSFVFDPIGGYSSGDLNLATGEVTNLALSFNFFNNFYTQLASVNPNLVAGPFNFPGTLGTASAIFTQSADGQTLQLQLYASTFAPLGNNISGDPVRIPLPFSGPAVEFGSFQAPGTSLHPHIRLSTIDPTPAPCGALCPTIPQNSVQVLTMNSQSTFDFDNFDLNIPFLGYPGQATARSHMQGRLQMQFGQASGGTVPFVMHVLEPEALLATPPASPVPLPPGFSFGAFGMNEYLVFPAVTYYFQNVVLSDNPFIPATGAVDLNTGQVVGVFEDQVVFVQSLLLAIYEQNLGQTPTSFPYRGQASFENGPNSELVFRATMTGLLPFTGVIWPGPDFTNTAHSQPAGPDSYLHPGLALQAMATVDTPTSIMTGSASATSSIGDNFTYNYSIPCNPALAANATFNYTNSGTMGFAGSFTLNNPAAVRCFNTRGSALPAGSYDTVSFSGFGSWSGDSTGGLHLVNFEVSTAPTAPYVSVFIDGGLTSQANTKPLIQPVP